MRFRPAPNTIRSLAACFLIIAAGALSLPSTAGQFAWPGMTDAAGTAASAARPALAIKSTAAAGEVVEYYIATLDHFFITSDPIEQAAVDSGAAGPWQRTGNTFKTGGPSQVCRFYGSMSPGPNSHFYTADAAECAALKQIQATTPSTQKRWNFESNDFLTTPAANGACPAGLVPVYRAYNNGFSRNIDSNHRITSNFAAYQQTVAAGWAAEGVVMCAPQTPAVTLPAQFSACGDSDCGTATSLGTGSGTVNVIVEVNNTTPTPFEFLIPTGQIFISSTETFRDGVAFEILRGTIAPGTTGRFVLRLFGMNSDRGASQAEAIYSLGTITTNAQLLDLMALAAGKLGSTLDPANIKATAVQFAVWEITDGTGTLTAQQRSILVSLLAAAADDFTGQSTLFEQFRATLSLQPE